MSNLLELFTTNGRGEEAGKVMRKEIKNREVNILKIKTYNMIKNAVWDCVLDL